MSTTLQFVTAQEAVESKVATLLIGSKESLESELAQSVLPAGAAPLWDNMVSSLSGGDQGDSCQSWLAGETPQRLAIGVLPEHCSRHNSPAHPHAVTSLVKSNAPGKGDVEIIAVLDKAEYAFATACAIARAFPLFSRKTSSKAPQQIAIRFVAREGELPATSILEHAAEGVRRAGRLVDTPTAELHTTAFAKEAEELAKELGVEYKAITGQELAEQGLGGLWNVGRTAMQPPRLVVLSHNPEGATETYAWVGKGIVYDTGGLSIKGKTTMPGMKCDMGGAAGVMSAFAAAVKIGFPQRLHALLCLAENAIGPDSFRPDDIITLYSGKTIEINNTDAEGRLVLGDGVAYASKHLNPDVIVDMATLTGAQLMATGKRHAAIVCNDDALEQKAIAAGKVSGDLVHPLPYCPEFFRKEFKSKVADMKNSVKDRMNAQSSCAGQFVAEHLVDYNNAWLHVDIAGPSFTEDRGNGYGVALLLQTFVL